MNLYLPRAFDERDLARLDALAAAHPFASLVTVGDGEPSISHAPVLYAREGERIELTWHLARANPQSRHRGRVLAVLHGPQAYVSPGWYPDKAEQARVPTWNYVVAHLSGDVQAFDDEASLIRLLDRLSSVHEAQAGGDWRFDPANAAERAQLRGIVGFRLVVDRIEFKSKLSQNHPVANRRAVIDRLAASARGADRDLADWMRPTLDPQTEGA
ncbi:MAG TPA: FMN-binding negative transcriptional regulator [Lysobacter sp.]|nr:FMN-binding negative transcriptional regulator [Lysobacter sp.]